MAHNWQVGQQVYVVPREKRYGQPHFATITKIAHKWVTTVRSAGSLQFEDRFDVESGCYAGKGCSSNATAYPSKEEYENTVLLRKEWSDLRVRLTYEPPPGMTRDRIAELRRELL